MLLSTEQEKLLEGDFKEVLKKLFFSGKTDGSLAIKTNFYNMNKKNVQLKSTFVSFCYLNCHNADRKFLNFQ